MNDMSFGLTYRQLIALRNDMVKMARKFEVEKNEDACFDCWVEVGMFQGMIDAHPENPKNR